MKVRDHQCQRFKRIKAPTDEAAGAAFWDARIFAKQNVAAIPAVVVQDSPPPPPKESSGSNIQVGDNYSVPTKSKSNSDNNSDNNDDNNNDSNNDNCIIISDTDSCDEYFTEDISEEALLDLDEYFDVDNHEHGRTAFAVKSHTSKEILPNQAGVESMEQNGPDVSEYSDVIHDDTEESPVPGSDEWIELQCPGLLVNGVVNRNVSRYMDQSVMLRIVKELRGLPKAQREPKVFSGIFCPKTYLNNIRCIAEVSKKGDICEFHRKGERRRVTCTSFTKKGRLCTKQSKAMSHSQQEEWGYLCGEHRNSMFQRGHLYRSGMPASLLARVKISPSILLKDQKEEKEHEDLSFVLSWRKEILITADKFNDLTRYLDASIKKGLRTIICSYFQFLSSGVRREGLESFTEKGDRELYEECFKRGYVYIMECKEYELANVCSIQNFCSSVGFKIGYSGQLVDRIISMHNSHCKVKILPLSTFPKLTGHDNRLCFVYLLEKIMHTIFVANQYDVSCEHRNPWRDRTTHTEFFWFKAVPGDNAPYERTKYEILKLIENIATPWMEVLMDLEHKFYGRLRGLGDVT